MAPTEHGKTILLAEDEETFRSYVLSVLQRNGYNVIVAIDGQDALNKSRQFTETIHLLVSDVQMPNMTGIELAKQLQMDRPNLRVLLMSGIAAGMLLLNEDWQFLRKPFMGNILQDRVRHLLQEGPIPPWNVAAESSGE